MTSESPMDPQQAREAISRVVRDASVECPNCRAPILVCVSGLNVDSKKKIATVIFDAIEAGIIVLVSAEFAESGLRGETSIPVRPVDCGEKGHRGSG